MNAELTRVVKLTQEEWDSEKEETLDGLPPDKWVYIEDMARELVGPDGRKGMCEVRAATPEEVLMTLATRGIRCPFHHTSRGGPCEHVFRPVFVMHTGELNFV